MKEPAAEEHLKIKSKRRKDEGGRRKEHDGGTGNPSVSCPSQDLRALVLRVKAMAVARLGERVFKPG